MQWRLGADGVRLGGQAWRGTRRGAEGEEAARLSLGLEVKGGNRREIKAGTGDDRKEKKDTEIVVKKKRNKVLLNRSSKELYFNTATKELPC